MRKSRLISLPLAATLSAAAFAGPAAAANLPGPPTWPTNPQPITSYATHPPGPPTWPTNPQPITAYRSTVQATDAGFDWGSAGIGAAASTAIRATGIAGLSGMRRRHERPHSLTTS
jgi:hypothetical protein